LVYSDILLAKFQGACIISIDTTTGSMQNITCENDPKASYISQFIITPKLIVVTIRDLSSPTSDYYIKTYSWNIVGNKVVFTLQDTTNIGSRDLMELAYSHDDGAVFGLVDGPNLNVSFFVYYLDSRNWKEFDPVNSFTWGACSMVDLQSMFYNGTYYYTSCSYLVQFDTHGSVQKTLAFDGPGLVGFPVESAVFDLKTQSIIGVTTFYLTPPMVHDYTAIVDPNTGNTRQMNGNYYFSAYSGAYGSTFDWTRRRWFLMVKSYNTQPNHLLILDVSDFGKPLLISNITIAIDASRVQFLSVS